MSIVDHLAEALTLPIRVSFTGMGPIVQCEPDVVQFVAADDDMPLGLLVAKRGLKMFIAWSRIVTIESLPKEEA